MAHTAELLESISPTEAAGILDHVASDFAAAALSELAQASRGRILNEIAGRVTLRNDGHGDGDL